ncbi:MAG: virulence RhuM family protein [Candidatus Aminicenantes bacterium]|nr:virulence RhuM family protein [Candidatus Aminicenantes bacterium]
MNDMQPKNILIYRADDNSIRLEVKLEEKAIWLSQKQIGELYQKSKATISEHIKNIYQDGELDPVATVRNFRTVQKEGDRPVERLTECYNLDMILAIGYRVRSHVGTKFRQWATEVLKEYIIKGFVLDDERLKNPGRFGDDYFDELLQRIQDIRISERRFYQKITDIYTLSIDYDPNHDLTHEFFQTVQNKLHWAITGQTAAEIVYSRADSSKPNMGLTSWKYKKIRKPDTLIAKNYLAEDELTALKGLVEQYLVFAETRAKEKIPMRMIDWIKKLDGFLELNEKNILEHAGKISHEMAVEVVDREYEKYCEIQKNEANQIESDFDKAVKQLTGENYCKGRR